jgi:hypothetical protein
MRVVFKEIIIQRCLLRSNKDDQYHDAAQVGNDLLPVKITGDQHVYVKIEDADKEKIIYQLFDKKAGMQDLYAVNEKREK